VPHQFRPIQALFYKYIFIRVCFFAIHRYDRTAAIGLLDGVPRQFGSVETSIQDIATAGEAVCALDAAANSARFSTTQVPYWRSLYTLERRCSKRKHDAYGNVCALDGLGLTPSCGRVSCCSCRVFVCACVLVGSVYSNRL